MTREEIIAKWDGQTPREHDAWVAEVVFGWKPLGDGRMRSSDGFMIRAIPEYTSDISEAWTVVDASKTDFLVRRRTCGLGYRAWVSLSRYDAEAGVSVNRPIAPEAICLAAITASLQSD